MRRNPPMQIENPSPGDGTVEHQGFDLFCRRIAAHRAAMGRALQNVGLEVPGARESASTGDFSNASLEGVDFRPMALR
jgi:hypothetical protein